MISEIGPLVAHWFLSPNESHPIGLLAALRCVSFPSALEHWSDSWFVFVVSKLEKTPNETNRSQGSAYLEATSLQTPSRSLKLWMIGIIDWKPEARYFDLWISCFPKKQSRRMSDKDEKCCRREPTRRERDFIGSDEGIREEREVSWRVYCSEDSVNKDYQEENGTKPANPRLSSLRSSSSLYLRSCSNSLSFTLFK